jgi:PST family polysaccharide transporter
MRKLSPRVIAQLHTFACLVGGGFFALSFLAVPLVAGFFRKEHISSQDLELLIAVNNVGFLVTGLQAVPFALLSKNLDYRRLSIGEAAQVAVQSLGTIAAAWLGWGYWSMTAGVFLGRFLRTGLLLYWNPIPFVRPHWESIREAVHMGGKMSLGRLAWSTYLGMDGIIVGRVLGDSALGVYRIALNVASAPAEKVSMLIMRTSTPLFARVQHDVDQVRRYLITMVELLSLGLMPLMLGLIMVAPEAIQATIGAKWLPAVPALQWLCAFMVIRVLTVLYEQVLVSQNMVDFTMWMSIFNLCVLPPAFWIGATWGGTAGVAAMWLGMVPFTVLPIVIRLHRRIQLSYWTILHAIWPAVSSAAAMVSLLLLLRPWLDSLGLSLLQVLTIEISLGGLVYAAVLLAFFRHRVMRYFDFVKRMRTLRQEAASPERQPA